MDDEKPNITVGDIDRAPTKLPTVEGKTYSPEDLDKLLDRLNDVANENLELKEENQRLRSKRAAAEELNQLIRPYASRAFWFMCGYCGVVAALLFASGAKFWGLAEFKLSNSVLEFLVGSTAVTVIGLVGMVLTGIFVGARK